jgi:uncharacterized membrane protein
MIEMRENESAKVYLALACACVTFTILAALVLSPLAILGVVLTFFILILPTTARKNALKLIQRSMKSQINESAMLYLVLGCASFIITIGARIVRSPLAIVGIIPTVLFLLFATMAILGVDWLEA